MPITVNFWVDIEDSSGSKIGAGPLKPSFFDRGNPLSVASQFSFPISPADPNIGAIASKLFAICRYLDQDGVIQEFGGGIIDSIDKSYQFSKDSFIISGPNLTGELTYRTVKQLQIGDTSGGDNDAPDQIMALAPAGWSILNGTTIEDIYVRYDGQTVLNALVSLTEATGEHFRLGDGRQIVWVGPYTGFSASGVRAIGGVPQGQAAHGATEIMIIKNLRELEDSHEMITRIYPRGSGNGNAVLKLLALTEALPAGFTANISEGYIEDDAQIAAGVVIEKEIDFKNISPISNSAADKQNAANQLMRAAVQHLRRWSTPQTFYEVELRKADTLLLPGTTIRIIFKQTINEVDIFDIDATFNIIDVTDRLGINGIFTQSISVSTTDAQPLNDRQLVISQLESARVVSTHAQMNANARWLRTQGTMDDSNPIEVPFWLGAETVSINNCILRFQINPLRSTVQSVAGSSTTTTSGGGSTSGSGGGGLQSSSSTTPTHSHNLTFDGNTPSAGDHVGLTSASTMGTAGGAAAGSFPTTGAVGGSHSHDVTYPTHDHTTPDHDHDLTPNITTVYGIFEESGANTLAVGDLVIKVNGVTFVGSVTSIGGGWFEADITDEIVDSIFSPIQEANDVEYSTVVAKTASIITDLSFVDVVQAVSIV